MPRETARLQSFPEDYKMHNEIVHTDNDFYTYKQFGNSLNLIIAKMVERELIENY
jgi:DNA (cytosine-5)-methyltransferase 1